MVSEASWLAVWGEEMVLSNCWGCFTLFFLPFSPTVEPCTRLCLAAHIHLGKIKKVCSISKTWTLLQWPVVCKNKVLIWVSLYGFRNPGWGYCLWFIFYCKYDFIANLIFQVSLAKREGLFNLSLFLGTSSDLEQHLQQMVNVRFKLRNSQNRQWTNKNSLIYETVSMEKTGINLLISVYGS